ncbi:cytochrome c oxidase assembly protein [Sphingobium sufflavum]|uniref:cytochrome c oxidase assembly protein n=1 Tax=Sphingobium sufflavum TaxID=1129547 RepID=UPI001F2B76D6|nr:cytochrome c oxidase assembly protein [Sphingobium sufflavum]MCE7798793.1 cytochrome c oxidase assembly protein [Sphingobium sufflavum]
MKHGRTAKIALAVAFLMFGVGFASVPLYRMFCQATGFGGTTMRGSESELAAIAAGGRAGTGRQLSIRFDSNIAQGMPWEFKPEQRIETVRVGQKQMAIFIARNLSDKPVTGRATFNVTPDQSGAYFAKIQCFCFTEQTLQPGQEVRMPVLYYIDPKILDDQDNKDVQEITLSYTFYPVEKDGNQG